MAISVIAAVVGAVLDAGAAVGGAAAVAAPVIAGVGAAGSAAAAGYEGYESHAAQVHMGQNERDQQYAASVAQGEIAQQNKANEAQQAGAVALARQRAVASMLPSTYGGTLGQGGAGQQNFAGKTLTGQ